MAPMTAPLLVAGLLLVLGGAPKIIRPAPAVGAVRTVGIGVPAAGVRLFGAGETLVGIAAALVGGTVVATLAAASYAGFAGFVLLAVRRGGAVSSCGCVGRDDTPPTLSHVVVTAGLAVVAATAAATDTAGIAGAVWSGVTVITLAFAGVATWLCWLALAALPRLSTVRMRPGES